MQVLNWCRRLAAGLVMATLNLAAHADTLTPEQSARDVRVLQRTLTALHPALTKYRTRAEIDAAFASFAQRGQAARSPAEMYLAATELAAAIRCGHTWTNVLNQSGGAKAALLDAADKLPLRLSWVEDRWLVLASSDPAAAAGDELLSVDGMPAREMVARLMPYLRADGRSDNKRLRQLGGDRADHNAMDMLWPLLSPPVQGRYRAELRRPSGRVDTVSLAATTLAARGFKPPSDAWSFTIEGGIATLTMPTWGFWNSSFDWAAFIDDSFAALNRQQVPNLVIDIRANEGGDGAIGNRVLAHLLRQPLSYEKRQNVSNYERVPYALARYLDTWDYRFFDRTGDVEPITEGTAAGKFRVKSKVAAPGLITPVPQPYAGRTFVLIGGENSSATFVFADLVQRTGVSTLVGQATGGNQRGLNGGEIAWVVLPHSGVAVDIPLLAASYAEATPDASVTPDLPVAPRFAAAVAGRDLDKEAVLSAISAADAVAARPAPPRR